MHIIVICNIFQRDIYIVLLRGQWAWVLKITLFNGLITNSNSLFIYFFGEKTIVCTYDVHVRFRKSYTLEKLYVLVNMMGGRGYVPHDLKYCFFFHIRRYLLKWPLLNRYFSVKLIFILGNLGIINHFHVNCE